MLAQLYKKDLPHSFLVVCKVHLAFCTLIEVGYHCALGHS